MIDHIDSEVSMLARHLRSLMRIKVLQMKNSTLPNTSCNFFRPHLFLLWEIHESLCCYDAAPNRTFYSAATIQHVPCLAAEAVCFGLD